jgi:uncharacterized protein YukE
VAVAQRVLATEESRSTITQMKQILEGGLQQNIQTLNRLGTTLSDPAVWDGVLAESFRSQIWPECKASLENTQRELNELHQKLQTIAQNIMQAGGNG